jgi:vancomycin resistance protein YoaR
VGFALDVEATLKAALAAGRSGSALAQLGWWLGRVAGPARIEARADVDPGALGRLVDDWEPQAIDDPPFEGAVVVQGDRPVARLPRAGWVVDRDAAATVVARALADPARPVVDLPLRRRAALRSREATEAAATEAARLVASAVVLHRERAGLEPPPPIPLGPAPRPAQASPGKSTARAPLARLAGADDRLRIRFERPVLLGALRSRLVERPEPGLVLYLDPDAVAAALGPARAEVEAPPRDARFVVDGHDHVYLVPGSPARVVDAQQVAVALLAAARSPRREAPFPIEQGAEPTVTTAALRALGVRGLVAKFTTVHPCCQPRVANIHRIADLVDGVLIAPGETYSINQHIGPRTAAKGFVPAPTIVEGEMEDTLGGGISQFATTLFNAAFYGGYDIVERAPHSYYFKRYPMGHEATLSYPKPDLVIRNDTAAGLLVRCSYSPTTITVKLYGDNGGRKVQRKVSRVTDVVEPPIEFVADDSLDPGEEKVKERGQAGWTVYVARTIELLGGEKREERRKVVYQPRVRRVRVHSCMIPEGKEGYTGLPCPEPEKDEDDASDERSPAHATADGGPTATEG